jgi:hypothetical protein
MMNIMIYDVGADCVVLELCSAFGPNSRSTITEHLNEFASDGLRTLVFAERILVKYDCLLVVS